MCLGVPGQIVSVHGKTAVVDFWGVRKSVRLDEITEPLSAGDTIIAHSGQAVRKLASEDVCDTLALYEVILTEAGCDPIATDVVDALEASEGFEIEVPVPA